MKLSALNETAVGVEWVIDEAMTRTSHALVDDGKVWLVDPVDVPEAIDRATALGEVAGVLQLLDRHPRDCKALAKRFGVERHRLPSSLPGTPFEIFDVVDVPKWREKGLWWADRRALLVPEAVGTGPMFTAGKREAGVHIMLRGLPPRGALDGYSPEHLLVGHGPGVHGPEASRALRDALERSRSDLPAAVVNLPRAYGKG